MARQARSGNLGPLKSPGAELVMDRVPRRVTGIWVSQQAKGRRSRAPGSIQSQEGDSWDSVTGHGKKQSQVSVKGITSGLSRINCSTDK